MTRFLCRFIVSFVLIVCVVSAQGQETLRDIFAEDFAVGAAVSTRLPGGRDKATLKMLSQQFNAVTPENCMKFGNIHPQLNRYNFGSADRLVEFAEKHKMAVTGHTLVWHSAVPGWVFTDEKGRQLDRDALLGRLTKHIEKVMGRYRGRIRGWDVVNEAFNGDGSLRRTKWREIIGDDYIEQVFKIANRVDPKAELYYNDFGMAGRGKREATVRLVNRLKKKGIRIDGVGMQGHWSLGGPSMEQIEESIKAFAAAGVHVHITELDIDVLPGRPRGGDLTQEQYNKKVDPYREGLPDDMQKKLAERYAGLFALFLKHRKVIDRVTFWGVSDRYSWKNNFPIRGRVNHALLFDREANPKPAFHAVVSLRNNKTDNPEVRK